MTTTPLTDARAAGLTTRREALESGHDDKSIKRLIRSRIWTRVRNGAYIPSEAWAAASALERHRIHAVAVSLSLGDRVALSHTTAAILMGLDTWNPPLEHIHVTRLDESPGRHERDLIHHAGGLTRKECIEWDGLLLTPPTRTVLDSTAMLTAEQGLIIADSALRLGHCSREELLRTHDGMARWPGTRHCHIVARLADGRAESPGESRVRYLCFRNGIPLPILQFEVRDRSGRLVGITDFAWPDHGLLGEFDGKVKYGDLVRPGQSATDVLFAEKKREDRLREVTGYRVIRITWADLERPGQLVARIREHLHGVA